MRKLLLTLALLTSTAAIAEVTVSKVSLSTEFGQAETSAGVESSSVSFSGFVFLSNGISIEARNVTSQADKTATANYGAPVSWQELGVGYSKDLGVTRLYGKLFLNSYEKSNARYAGHAEEVGFAGKFGSSPFSYQLGYRWTDSFDNNRALKARNTQIRTTISYAINKSTSVYLRNQDQEGDVVQKVNNIGVAYSF